MLFSDLLRFRRNSAGKVPSDVLKSLAIPMPDDVLDQLLFDHGLNHDFQSQYGHLELHSLQWKLVSISASEITSVSIYPRFNRYVEAVAGNISKLREVDWEGLELPPCAADHWQKFGTWMRSPVMIRGDLVNSNASIHLMEGHTRVGALRGLVNIGILPPSSMHNVWVGDRAEIDSTADQIKWCNVLKEERTPFVDWMIYRDHSSRDLDDLIFAMVDAEHSGEAIERSLEAVESFASRVPKFQHLQNEILQSHRTWELFVNPDKK